MRSDISRMASDIESIVYEVENGICEPKPYVPFRMSDYIEPQHVDVEEDITIQEKVASDNEEYEADQDVYGQIKADSEEYEEEEGTSEDLVEKEATDNDDFDYVDVDDIINPIIDNLCSKTNIFEKIAMSKNRQLKKDIKSQPQEVRDEYNKNYSLKNKALDGAAKLAIPEAAGGVATVGVNKLLKRKPDLNSVMEASKKIGETNKNIIKNEATMSPEQARKALEMITNNKNELVKSGKKYLKDAGPGIAAGTIASGLAAKTIGDKIRNKKKAILEEAKNKNNK